jgi:hypothetical protein
MTPEARDALLQLVEAWRERHDKYLRADYASEGRAVTYQICADELAKALAALPSSAPPEPQTEAFDEGALRIVLDQHKVGRVDISLNARVCVLHSVLTRAAAPNCGVDLIAAERERQVSVKGWTAEHDDCHQDDEALLIAALHYIDRGSGYNYGLALPEWPWSDTAVKGEAGDIRCLVKAGALLAAEIDLRLRVAALSPAAPAARREGTEK